MKSTFSSSNPSLSEVDRDPSALKPGSEATLLSQEILITGMTCAACVQCVENAVASVPGVALVEVSLATEAARVQCAPGA